MRIPTIPNFMPPAAEPGESRPDALECCDVFPTVTNHFRMLLSGLAGDDAAVHEPSGSVGDDATASGFPSGWEPAPCCLPGALVASDARIVTAPVASLAGAAVTPEHTWEDTPSGTGLFLQALPPAATSLPVAPAAPAPYGAAAAFQTASEKSTGMPAAPSGQASIAPAAAAALAALVAETTRGISEAGVPRSGRAEPPQTAPEFSKTQSHKPEGRLAMGDFSQPGHATAFAPNAHVPEGLQRGAASVAELPAFQGGLPQEPAIPADAKQATGDPLIELAPAGRMTVAPDAGAAVVSAEGNGAVIRSFPIERPAHPLRTTGPAAAGRADDGAALSPQGPVSHAPKAARPGLPSFSSAQAGEAAVAPSLPARTRYFGIAADPQVAIAQKGVADAPNASGTTAPPAWIPAAARASEGTAGADFPLAFVDAVDARPPLQAGGSISPVEPGSVPAFARFRELPRPTADVRRDQRPLPALSVPSSGDAEAGGPALSSSLKATPVDAALAEPIAASKSAPAKPAAVSAAPPVDIQSGESPSAAAQRERTAWKAEHVSDAATEGAAEAPMRIMPRPSGEAALPMRDAEGGTVNRLPARSIPDSNPSGVTGGFLTEAAGRESSLAAPSRTPSTDSTSSGFVFELAERISLVVAANRNEMTIQLKPETLGRMKVVAENGASGLVARITTESGSVKHLLENNLPVLQQALQDQGLKVDRIDILVQERFDPQQPGNYWQQQAGHGHSGQEGGRQTRYPVAADAPAAAAAAELAVDTASLSVLHPNSTFHTVA